MRPIARLFLLSALASACSPAAVNLTFDAGADAPRVAADTPAAVDVPTAPTDVPTAPADVPTTPVDAPAVVDVGVPADVPSSPVDSGVTPPPDAGPLPVDGGALGEPVWVPLDVRSGSPSCPPLAPCGGNEVGTWDVGGGCIDIATPAELMSCPGARVDRASGRARGRVTYAAGFARRASQWEVQAELLIPQLCVAVIGGCATFQTLVQAVYPGASCVIETSGCRCTVRQSGVIDDGDRYTVSGNQLVSSASGKRWNYCIAGNQLRYQDVSASGPREVGIIQLTRRAP